MALADWLLHERWIVRAPIVVFRLRLGGLTGGRLLLLEHRGRTTGARRAVVLEVIGRANDGRVYVSSGLGPTSQWFRNIEADPRVLVSLGWSPPRRYHAEVLSGGQAADVLGTYVNQHPVAWRELEPVLRGWAEDLARDRGEPDWRRVVPVIALRPLS